MPQSIPPALNYTHTFIMCIKTTVECRYNHWYCIALLDVYMVRIGYWCGLLQMGEFDSLSRNLDLLNHTHPNTLTHPHIHTNTHTSVYRVLIACVFSVSGETEMLERSCRWPSSESVSQARAGALWRPILEKLSQAQQVLGEAQPLSSNCPSIHPSN